MARGFSSGNYLQNNGGVTGIDNRYMAWSFWSKWNGSSAGGELLSQSIGTSTQINRWFSSVSGAGYRFNMFQNWNTPSNTYRGYTADQTSQAWQHWFIFWDRGGASTNDPVVYADNSLVTWTQSRNPAGSTVTTGQDTITVGAYFSGTLPAVNFEIGEVAFWNMSTIMSANDRQALADGIPAWKVRKDSLVWSSRMMEASGDCKEQVAGEDLTETGTTTYISHPPTRLHTPGRISAGAGHRVSNPIGRWWEVPHKRYNAGETLNLTIGAVSGQCEDSISGITKVEFVVTPPSGVEYDPESSAPGADVPHTHTITAQTLNTDITSAEYTTGLWGFVAPIEVDDFDGAGEVSVAATIYGEDGATRDSSTQGGGQGLDDFTFIVDPDSGTPASARPAPRAYADTDGNARTAGSGSNDGRDNLGFSITGGTWTNATSVLTKTGAFSAYTPATGELDIIYIEFSATENGWFQVDNLTVGDEANSIDVTLVAGPGFTVDRTVTTSTGPKATIHTAIVAGRAWRNSYDANNIIDGLTVYCTLGNYDTGQPGAVEYATSDEWLTITRAPGSGKGQVVFGTQSDVLTRTKLWRFKDVFIREAQAADNALADASLCFEDCDFQGNGITNLASTSGIAWNLGSRTLTGNGEFDDYFASQGVGDRIHVTDGSDEAFYEVASVTSPPNSDIILGTLATPTSGWVPPATGTVTCEGVWRYFPTLTSPIGTSWHTYFDNCTIEYSADGLDNDSVNNRTIELARNVAMDYIANDAFSGGCSNIVNCVANNVNAGVAAVHDEWHPDLWEGFAPTAERYNVIVANFRGIGVSHQGAIISSSGTVVRDVALCNIYMEQDADTEQAIHVGRDEIDNLVEWHCTFRYKGTDYSDSSVGTWNYWKNPADANPPKQLSNTSIRGCMMSRIKLRGAAHDVAGIIINGEWNRNHYEVVGSYSPMWWYSPGSNVTTGASVLDPNGYPTAGSPLIGAMTETLLLPGDLDGFARSDGAAWVGAYETYPPGGFMLLKYPYPMTGI